MKIRSKEISSKSEYYLKDLRADHEKYIHLAKDLKFFAAAVGADAAKFQLFKAYTILFDFGLKNFVKKFSYLSNWVKKFFEFHKETSKDIS